VLKGIENGGETIKPFKNVGKQRKRLKRDKKINHNVIAQLPV